MGKDSFFGRVVSMYVDGFRGMTVGRRLWALILVKLAILFLVFRLFFFPDILQEGYDNDADRAQAVRSALAAPAVLVTWITTDVQLIIKITANG